MPLWLRLARILSREALYRFTKSRGFSFSFLRVDSLLLTNVVGVFLFTLTSVSISLASIYTGVYRSDPFFISTIYLIEVSMGVFISLIMIANNLHTLMSDRLIDSVLHLPISDREIRLSLLALMLYWGILTQPFLIVPGAFLFTYYSGEILFFIFGLLLAIFALCMTIGLGFLAGSISPRITRSRLVRAVSTMVWLIFMGIGFVIGFGGRYFRGFGGILYDPDFISRLRFLPPFSFVYPAYGYYSYIFPSLLWLSLSILILYYGIDRYWRSLYIIKAPLDMDKKVGWSLWRVPISKWVYKDLKLLVRSPRNLANIIYMLLFPALIPLIFSGGRFLSIDCWLLPIIVMVFASTAGLSISTLYIIEGEGAIQLYYMPITRGELIMRKASTILYLSIILSIVYFLTSLYICGEIYSAILTQIIFILSMYSSSLLASNIYVKEFPDTPSTWTIHTLAKPGVLIKVLLLEVIYIVLAGIAAIPYGVTMIQPYIQPTTQIPPTLKAHITMVIIAFIEVLALTLIIIRKTKKMIEPL